MQLGFSLMPRLVTEVRLEFRSATESIFPSVDELLEQTRYQEALKYVAGRKNMNKYRSMVDFLFCELFTQFRAACLAFYDNDGPPLRKMVPKNHRQQYAIIMVSALDRALQAKEREERLSWRAFSGELRRHVA